MRCKIIIPVVLLPRIARFPSLMTDEMLRNVMRRQKDINTVKTPNFLLDTLMTTTWTSQLRNCHLLTHYTKNRNLLCKSNFEINFTPNLNEFCHIFRVRFIVIRNLFEYRYLAQIFEGLCVYRQYYECRSNGMARLHSENTINRRRFGAESDPNYSIV